MELFCWHFLLQILPGLTPNMQTQSLPSTSISMRQELVIPTPGVKSKSQKKKEARKFWKEVKMVCKDRALEKLRSQFPTTSSGTNPTFTASEIEAVAKIERKNFLHQMQVKKALEGRESQQMPERAHPPSEGNRNKRKAKMKEVEENWSRNVTGISPSSIVQFDECE